MRGRYQDLNLGHMAKKNSQNSNDEKETKFKVLINVLTSHAAKLLKVAIHVSRVVLLRSSL